jgi:hypothetical protein
MIEIFKCQSDLFDKHATISKNIEKVYIYIKWTCTKVLIMDLVEWWKAIIKDFD